MYVLYTFENVDNKSVDSHGPPSQIKFPIESNRVIVVTGLIEHDQASKVRKVIGRSTSNSSEILTLESVRVMFGSERKDLI